MKITARAPSNIAFIKYWGLVDPVFRIPTNGSVSMNLSNLTTTTTVEFSENYTSDDIMINDNADTKVVLRVQEHLDRIRKVAGINTKAKVVSKNNFPTATGLSSSASGFAALTVAGVKAAGLDLSEKELSILARQGSGSACRSIPDGFIEWTKGTDSDTSYAYSIFPADWWEIVDIVVFVSSNVKKTPTTNAHQYVNTSPFFSRRLANIDGKIDRIKHFIKHHDFVSFGELVESEALELHAIMMTSSPSFIYLYPETINLMHSIKKWRTDGLPVYFSLNTGHNIHIICEKDSVPVIKAQLESSGVNLEMIINEVSQGAELVATHLF